MSHLKDKIMNLLREEAGSQDLPLEELIASLTVKTESSTGGIALKKVIPGISRLKNTGRYPSMKRPTGRSGS